MIMIKNLIKLANYLDDVGETKEANYLDKIIKSAIPEVILSDPERAPAQAEFIINAPKDAARELLNEMITSFPGVAESYEAGVVISDISQMMYSKERSSDPNISEQERQKHAVQYENKRSDLAFSGLILVAPGPIGKLMSKFKTFFKRVFKRKPRIALELSSDISKIADKNWKDFKERVKREPNLLSDEEFEAFFGYKQSEFRNWNTDSRGLPKEVAIEIPDPEEYGKELLESRRIHGEMDAREEVSRWGYSPDELKEYEQVRRSGDYYKDPDEYFEFKTKYEDREARRSALEEVERASNSSDLQRAYLQNMSAKKQSQ